MLVLDKPPAEVIPNPTPNSAVFRADLPGTRSLTDIRQTMDFTKSILSPASFGESDPKKTATKLKYNLFTDILANDYTAMRQVNVEANSSKPYLEVGAVVNMVNSKFAKNELLLLRAKGDTYNNIPMLLQVVKGRSTGTQAPQGEVVASYPFEAKIGSYTLVQKYWDDHLRNGVESDSVCKDL